MIVLGVNSWIEVQVTVLVPIICQRHVVLIVADQRWEVVVYAVGETDVSTELLRLRVCHYLL